MSGNAAVRDARAEAPAEVVIPRLFDAPRPCVWRAWTDPAQLEEFLAKGGAA